MVTGRRKDKGGKGFSESSPSLILYLQEAFERRSQFSSSAVDTDFLVLLQKKLRLIGFKQLSLNQAASYISQCPSLDAHSCHWVQHFPLFSSMAALHCGSSKKEQRAPPASVRKMSRGKPASTDGTKKPQCMCSIASCPVLFIDLIEFLCLLHSTAWVCLYNIPSKWLLSLQLARRAGSKVQNFLTLAEGCESFSLARDLHRRKDSGQEMLLTGRTRVQAEDQ